MICIEIYEIIGYTYDVPGKRVQKTSLAGSIPQEMRIFVFNLTSHLKCNTKAQGKQGNTPGKAMKNHIEGGEQDGKATREILRRDHS